jgi:carbonic anhydrase/acetyltransferase-like protein (isoleucine patch superfamily)
MLVESKPSGRPQCRFAAVPRRAAFLLETFRMIDPTVFIARGAIVLGDVDLGKDVSVWYNAVIRGDTDKISIGAETNIQDLTMIHADPGIPCMVGNRVTVGHRVILHGCTIEDDCLIGMGAIVLNNVHVGRGSVIGAGAVLLEGTEVPPGSVVVGIPGRVKGQVDAAMIERLEHGWRHYVDQARRHRAGELPIEPETTVG